MVCTSKTWLCAIAVLLAVSVQSQAQGNADAKDQANKATPPKDQIVAEEVLVESRLNVRNPPQNQKIRRNRDVIYYLVPDLPLVRAKRDHRGRGFGGGPGFGGSGGPGFGSGFQQPNYGNSQSTAQSASNSNLFGPHGAQIANAQAGAQGFTAQGPAGSFGATSSNAHTNTQNTGLYGSSGSLSNSGGQTYTLPNGQTLNIAFNNAFSNTNGNPANSQGSSVSFSG